MSWEYADVRVEAVHRQHRRRNGRSEGTVIRTVSNSQSTRCRDLGSKIGHTEGG